MAAEVLGAPVVAPKAAQAEVTARRDEVPVHWEDSFRVLMAKFDELKQIAVDEKKPAVLGELGRILSHYTAADAKGKSLVGLREGLEKIAASLTREKLLRPEDFDLAPLRASELIRGPDRKGGKKYSADEMKPWEVRLKTRGMGERKDVTLEALQHDFGFRAKVDLGPLTAERIAKLTAKAANYDEQELTELFAPVSASRMGLFADRLFAVAALGETALIGGVTAEAAANGTLTGVQASLNGNPDAVSATCVLAFLLAVPIVRVFSDYMAFRSENGQNNNLLGLFNPGPYISKKLAPEPQEVDTSGDQEAKAPAKSGFRQTLSKLRDIVTYSRKDRVADAIADARQKLLEDV